MTFPAIVSTPITSRNFQVNPLRDSEVVAVLQQFVTANLDTTATIVATGLLNFFSNKRGLCNEFSQWVALLANPATAAALTKDQYGNSSSILDNL